MDMIDVDKLQEGAVLAEDVYDNADALLLTAGTVMNARRMALLKSRGIKSVAVRGDEKPFRSEATEIIAAAVAAVASQSATGASAALGAAVQARMERLKGMFHDPIRNPWMRALFVAAARIAAEGRPRA